MTSTISKADLKRALKQKFGFEPVRGSKHEAFSLVVEGRKVAMTFFSRGARSEVLGPALLRQIGNQLRLEHSPTQVLRDMVGCSVSREQYLRELRERGYLS